MRSDPIGAMCAEEFLTIYQADKVIIHLPASATISLLNIIVIQQVYKLLLTGALGTKDGDGHGVICILKASYHQLVEIILYSLIFIVIIIPPSFYSLSPYKLLTT